MSSDNNEADRVSKVDDVVLPEWLTSSFPEHLPWSIISFKDGQFHVSHDGSVFDNIVEAFDYVRGFGGEYQTILDDSVDGQGGEYTDGFFMCDLDDGKSGRLLLSYTTESRVEELKKEYLTFLTEHSIEYAADPDNFLKAHTWLSYHPAFWSKGNKEKSFDWETDYGLHKMSINVWADEETSKPVIFLEHGMHIEPEFKNFYHDTRIFAREETYEKAIIQMAKKVSETYDLEGNERPE